MPELNFKVSTTLDTQGMEKTTRWLDDLVKKANNLQSLMAGAGTSTLSAPAASGGGIFATPELRPRRQSTGGGKYDLDTPNGLQQWTQNVFAPEASFLEQMWGGFSTKAFGARMQPRRKGPLDQIAGNSSQDVFGWFSGLQPSQMTNAHMRAAYSKAIGAASNMTSTQTPQEVLDFASQYGSQLGFGGSGGGTGGSGRSGMGGAASEIGGALGGLASKYLPFLTAAGAVAYGGSQVEKGYGIWQQSSGPMDQLAHSLGSTVKDVEQFRQQVSSAGAQFGYLSQQSAQAAQSLTQTFGNIGQNNIVNLVGSTAQFSQQNGFSIQQGTQLTNMSGYLGITQGYGSSMTASQFQGMLSNSATSAGMQGRQGPYDTGMMSSANAVVAQNGVLANPTYFSGMYSQAVGSMGGMRGASLFDQFNNSVMNASGYTQGIAFAAMQKTLGSKANGTSFVSMLGAQQGGLSSFVPGTHTTLGASLYQYITGSGMSQDQQIMALASYFGGNVNEAQEFLKNKGFGTKQTSTKNNQSTWYSLFDRNQQADAYYGLQQSELGYMAAPVATAYHGVGVGNNMLMAGLGMRYGSSLLSGMANGGGLMGGLRSAGGKMASDASKLRGLSLFGRGAATAGADVAGSTAADAGLAGAAGGLEAVGAGFDATGIGLPVGIALGAIGLGVGGYALLRNHQHATTASSHANQVKQQATQRTSSHLSNLTIDQLKINQITMPGGTASSGNSALANALTVGSAATAGGGNGSGSSSGGWWSDLTRDIGKLFGGGGTSSSGGSSSSMPVSQAQSQIKSILDKDGLSSWWGPTQQLLGIESGGGKNIISPTPNKSDGGQHAEGYFQFMPSTWTSLGFSGTPIQASLATQTQAYIDYVKKNYGNAANALKEESTGGYAVGGLVTRKQKAWVAENGPEMIIPLTGDMHTRAMSLYQQAGQALGLSGSSTVSAQASSAPGMVHLTPATLNTLIKGISNGVRQSVSMPAVFSSVSRGPVRP